ncbi:hypothetical protein O181_000593 [Austropuccinia psidii MF-1]|uniref:SH3 domain-containing protein n=1 Tax=Austropuccinia psidii MF-1 TaxID=1389203 RepID=A0A9Q3B8T9_9BASI|nr:hypothetical protein [Austropuccinia psidii MF-1]
MSSKYPYKAQTLMRFKAQDGQFVLNTNAIVTVKGQADDDGDWLLVCDDQGVTGTVPSGFLVQIDAQSDPSSNSPQLDSNQSLSSSALESNNQEVEESAPKSSPKSPAEPNSIQPASIPPYSAGAASIASIVPEPPASDTTLTSQTSLSSSLAPDPTSLEPPSQSATSKEPPQPASKPNALRDRIAMFNKPVSASGPPIAPAPRSKPPLARKTLSIPQPVPPVEVNQALSTTVSTSDQHKCAPAGMSAADAEESVKAGGSLKDRIRLLQQQQQPLSGEQQPISSKPKREWKRPPPPSGDEGQPPLAGMMVPISFQRPPMVDQAEERIGNDQNTALAEDSTEPMASEEAEEDEIARRRRIAERMAKLGGAKMGFGFPGLALAPKPSLPPQQPSEDIPLTPESPQLAETPAALPPNRVAIPTIPKKAVPPRRKAPVASNTVPTQQTTHYDEEHISSTDLEMTSPSPKSLDENLEPAVDTLSITNAPIDEVDSESPGLNLQSVSVTEEILQLPTAQPIRESLKLDAQAFDQDRADDPPAEGASSPPHLSETSDEPQSDSPHFETNGENIEPLDPTPHSDSPTVDVDKSDPLSPILNPQVEQPPSETL